MAAGRDGLRGRSGKAAEHWARDTQRDIDVQRNGDGPLTVTSYAERWLARRKTASVADDATRIRLHVLPHMGNMLLTEVGPRHARELIMALRNAGELARAHPPGQWHLAHAVQER